MPEETGPQLLEQEWESLLASLPPERVNSPRWFCGGGMPRPLGGVALFAELEDVRRGWIELRLSTVVEKYADRFVTTQWTLKDLLAHLASWATEFRREIETAARGIGFDYSIPYAMSVTGPTQWNQMEVGKRREKTLEAVFDEYQRETQRLQELILDLPDATMRAETVFPFAPGGDPAALMRTSIIRVVAGKCMHDRYHYGHIWQWLAAQARHEKDSEMR